MKVPLHASLPLADVIALLEREAKSKARRETVPEYTPPLCAEHDMRFFEVPAAFLFGGWN